MNQNVMLIFIVFVAVLLALGMTGCTLNINGTDVLCTNGTGIGLCHNWLR